MKFNCIELVVAVVIIVCCVASAAKSFVDMCAPLTIEQQRDRMEPTLALFKAYGLADERGRR